MQILVYMALVSIDDDSRPWFGMGHEALAEHALGRPAPITDSDIRAVERAITPLRRAGAIETDRRASVRRDGPSTARYRLVLVRRKASDDGDHAPRNPSGDRSGKHRASAVDNQAQDSQRPTESGVHARRISDSRPTNFGLTPDENRRTEEPRGTRRSEKTEEETIDLRTAVTVSRARGRAQDPIFPKVDRKPEPAAEGSGQASPAALPPIFASNPPTPPRRTMPPNNGVCVVCAAAGELVMATDPVAGSHCPNHLRQARTVTA
jgi:DNA-binding transcriptional ArsR family regulator